SARPDVHRPVDDAWKSREESWCAQAALLARPADCPDRPNSAPRLVLLSAEARPHSAEGCLKSVEDRQDVSKWFSGFRSHLAARLRRVPLRNWHHHLLPRRAV